MADENTISAETVESVNNLHDEYAELAKTLPHAVAYASVVKDVALGMLAFKVAEAEDPSTAKERANAIADKYVKDAQRITLAALEHG